MRPYSLNLVVKCMIISDESFIQRTKRFSIVNLGVVT